MPEFKGPSAYHHMAQHGLEGAEEFFADKAIKNAKMDTGHGSRATVVRMSPDEFLRMAAPLPDNEYTRANTADILEHVKSGGKLNDIPNLSVSMNDDGDLRIVGHEGRHRANVFNQLGVPDMPVVMRMGDDVGIRFSNANNNPEFGRSSFPDTVISESGKTVEEMPVKLEGDTYKTLRALGPFAGLLGFLGLAGAPREAQAQGILEMLMPPTAEAFRVNKVGDGTLYGNEYDAR